MFKFLEKQNCKALVFASLGLVVLFATSISDARAQDNLVAETQASAPTSVESDETEALEAAEQAATEPEVMPLSVKDDTDVAEISSLFFTPEALALIREAAQGLNSTSLADVGASSEKDPGIRELALGGIVYKKKEDWTIWLNGRRITPKTIPGEIFDISVYKDYIDLKWFDAYTNRLFPVRLRANERFNLDSRLFLTGTHSDDQQL